MNKLVSKNPVLRFKLGKKIVKAQGGVRTSRRTPGGLIIYDNNSSEPGFFSRFWSYLTSPLLFRVGMNGKPIVDTITKQNTISTPKDYSFMTKGRINPESELSKKDREDYFNKLKQKYNFVSTPSKPINSRTLVNNYYVKGFENRKTELAQQGKTVRDILKMLGFTGKDLDGKWGKDTELAYLNYLKSKLQQLAPELPSTTDLVLHITSLINFNQPNKSSAPFIYDLLLAAKEQAEKLSNNQYIPQEIPELFLAMLTGKYKKGGLLPSRNPILRFKSNFRYVAQ